MGVNGRSLPELLEAQGTKIDEKGVLLEHGDRLAFDRSIFFFAEPWRCPPEVLILSEEVSYQQAWRELWQNKRFPLPCLRDTLAGEDWVVKIPSDMVPPTPMSASDWMTPSPRAASSQAPSDQEAARLRAEIVDLRRLLSSDPSPSFFPQLSSVTFCPQRSLDSCVE